MAYTDYTHTIKQSLTGASGADLRWGFFLQLIAALHNDPVSPWTTRGSSRNGTAGSAFSATPDGVDHWTGRTVAQAANSTVVWHVLQNTATGHQICFLIGTSSGAASDWTLIFALNKFETGGAWRGGGSSISVRPTDVTSSPTAARELNTLARGFSPQSTSNYHSNFNVRKDGKGFYAVAWRDVTPDTTNDGFVLGYCPLTTPYVADANPYLAFIGNNATMGSTPFMFTGTNGSCVGRLQDGTLQEHRSLDIDHASLFLDRLDAWRSAYPVHGIAMYAQTTKDVRYWLPDLYIAHNTPSSSDFATRDSKKYWKANPDNTGHYSFIMPWDGLTTNGTDVPIYRFPESGVDGPVTTPSPSAPTGLAAVAGNAQIALTWNISVGAATSYTVKRALAGGGPYTDLVVAGITTTFYTDSAVVNGTPYYYVVTATNAQGTSGNSSEVTATPAAPAVPTAPTGLAITTERGAVELTWNVSATATSYSVKRGLVTGGPYTNLVVTGLTGTAYHDTTVASGTPYFYVVSASNASGEGSNSSQVTATPANPLVDTIVPANGASLGGVTPVTFHVTDPNPGVNTTYIWVQLAGESGPRLAFDGSIFKAPFFTLSTRNAITNGFAYSLAYDGGWPTVVSSVTVAATDLVGNVTEQSFGYIAVPPPPLSLQIVRPIDARLLEIVFNRAVVQSQAENIANYSISPTLQVLTATKVTDFNYRLTTAQQILDQAYAVTISGITAQ